jgi:hypothetical protein
MSPPQVALSLRPADPVRRYNHVLRAHPLDADVVEPDAGKIEGADR